jgi:prepilin-type N-terminal cleavage/methylation domain-containing protein
METPRHLRSRRSGFSLLEVLIAMLVLTMIGLSATLSMRESVSAMSGVDQSTRAVTALEQTREALYHSRIWQINQIAGTLIAPQAADGTPIPGMTDLAVRVDIVPVDDDDPQLVVGPLESGSRLVTLTVVRDGVDLEATSWLVTEG